MRGRIVTAPDGGRWRVRRRWLDRPAPKPWSRRALAALAATVETTGPPAALPEAEPLAPAIAERERMSA